MRHKRYKGKQHNISEVMSILRQMHNEQNTDDPQKPSVTIEGWVTRDEDGRVDLWNNKPKRVKMKCLSDIWHGGGLMRQLPNDSFPDLKWEDEPKLVTIQITEKC